jgi:1-acyl-sn-glycerol-3-phosphate acyltransferase
MRRLPLADQLPYQFFPPRLRPFWLWAARFYINHLMRKEQRIAAIDISGTEHLVALKGTGDGVMITPNHADHADCGVVFDLGRRIQWPFYYMAAYQIFTGIGRVGLPRIGVFPVDREGSDLTAFKTAVDIVAQGKNPLVIFPEGEIYNLTDKLTPIREGAAVLALTALKRAAEAKKNVWIVPTGIKYRFLDGYDPVPAFNRLMDELESRFTWRHRHDLPLADRIYRFAEGMLGLKEMEYLGASRSGPLKERIAYMREMILGRLEDKLLGKRHGEPVPVRVKELRHACLEKLADSQTTPSQKEELRQDLEDLFGVMQLFTYPGDYIRECPTVERVAEILSKLEEDVLGVDMPVPVAPRQAILRLGPPIDVKPFLGTGKLRTAGAALTTELEHRIQGLLDAIGPGRPITPPMPGDSQPTAQPEPQLQSSSA